MRPLAPGRRGRPVVAQVRPVDRAVAHLVARVGQPREGVTARAVGRDVLEVVAGHIEEVDALAYERRLIRLLRGITVRVVVGAARISDAAATEGATLAQKAASRTVSVASSTASGRETAVGRDDIGPPDGGGVGGGRIRSTPCPMRLGPENGSLPRSRPRTSREAPTSHLDKWPHQRGRSRGDGTASRWNRVVRSAVPPPVCCFRRGSFGCL